MRSEDEIRNELAMLKEQRKGISGIVRQFADRYIGALEWVLSDQEEGGEE